PSDLVNEGIERTVLAIGRAEIALPEMRLDLKTLLQSRGQARLTDAGLAGDQHDLAVPRLGARQASQQQVDFLVAAKQPCQRRSSQCLELARDSARTQHLRSRHRCG